MDVGLCKFYFKLLFFFLWSNFVVVNTAGIDMCVLTCNYSCILFFSFGSYYCSRTCQKADWKNHKKHCRDIQGRTPKEQKDEKEKQTNASGDANGK